MKKFMSMSLFILTASFVLQAEEPLRPYIGTDDFRELTRKGKLFADKTLLIKGLLANEKKVILITRPRRWGKSVNMNMLNYFFKEEVDSQGQRSEPQPYRYLFENLKISQEPGVIEQFQGQYPTIVIKLKDIDKTSYPEMKMALESEIVHLFSEYKYVSPISDWWQESQKRADLFLKKIRQEVINSNDIGFEKSLKTLSEWLHRHHGKPVYILIDEYDTPLNSASEHGYAQEAVRLLRSVLSPALKSNPHLEKGILTGILRIAGVNLFSGMNSFMEDSVLSNHYSAYYGFTEEEIDELLIKAQMGNKAEVKEWYNGYTIGKEIIYNPWSMVQYFDAGKAEPYWLRSGTTQLIERAMRSDDIQKDLATLRSGATITKSFKKDIEFFNFEQDRKALWPLLLYAGYLTTTGCQVGDEASEFICELKIPNREIARAYGDFLQNLLVSRKLPVSQWPQVATKAFDAIVKLDPVALSRIFDSQGKIIFAEGLWNFNLLHLAALTGDKTIFKKVFEHHQELRKLKSREGLGVADYAQCSGENFQELDGYAVLKKPSWWKHVCQINSGAAGILAGVSSYLLQKVLTLQQGYHWIFHRAVDAGIGTLAGFSAESFLNTHCQEYVDYHSIDISQPAEMDTMLQFRKYVLEYPGSYVSINGTCSSKHVNRCSFSKSPLNDAQYLVPRNVNFTLCSPVVDANSEF